MLRNILLYFKEVLCVKKVLLEMIKQNKVVNLLRYCKAIATLLQPFAKRLRDYAILKTNSKSIIRFNFPYF
jgi:hypothetical protein